VEKTSRESASCETQGNVRKFTAAEEKKIALDQRRAEQETPEWKKQYAKRSGVEGVHEALGRKTGIKALKVRGIKAVAMAVFFKVAGWNICAAAKIALARNKKAKKAAGKQNISTTHPAMRPQPAGLCRRKPARAHEPRFFRRQSEKIALVGQNDRIRHFVFAPASDKAECFHAVRDFSSRVRFEI